MDRSSIAGMVGLAMIISAATGAAQPGSVRGKLVLKDRGGKLASDVPDAVVWLEGPKTARATTTEIATRKKELIPSVVVVAPGSSVTFPNYDPFNHNVFSVSPEAPFDLGLYGRGDSRTAKFEKPGIVRVYCNVHAQMWAAVLVIESPFVARPSVDGGFALDGVPAGKYTLMAWHDRGGQTGRPIEVGPAGVADLELALDASGHTHKAHLNKFGKPYQSEGRRY
jgi:plastocyanin